MNLQRRAIIFGTLALPFLPLSACLLAGSAVASPPEEKLLLLYESGLLESARFVESWGSGRASAIEFQGDTSALLYERLVPMWRAQGPAAVAGLTSVSSFFCLSQVAADHGLRVLHRAAHYPPLSSVDWQSEIARLAARAKDGTGERQSLPLFELLPRSESAFALWLMVPRSWLTA